MISQYNVAGFSTPAQHVFVTCLSRVCQGYYLSGYLTSYLTGQSVGVVLLGAGIQEVVKVSKKCVRDVKEVFKKYVRSMLEVY